MSAPAQIGILTVSDRVSRSEYEDRGGPAISDYLEEVLSSPWQGVPRVVPDEASRIEEVMTQMDKGHRVYHPRF